MKTKTNVKARNLPFTVTAMDGTKRKRFQDPKDAWSYMREINGILHSAFRIAEAV